MLPEQCADAGEILFGVDTRCRCSVSDLDGDPIAVPKRAQLLECLERLDRCGRELRKRLQEAHAIRVKTVMTVERHVHGDVAPTIRERVARPRNCRAAEVE